MRSTHDLFHLAIPAYDLEQAREFYVTQLGCKLARSYADRITLDFFGDQLVCHLTEPPPAAGTVDGADAVDAAARPILSLYPRHFGVTFEAERDFDDVYRLVVQRKVRLFRDVSTRFEGLVEVHRTFVLQDPSDNLVEFKHYRDKRMMY